MLKFRARRAAKGKGRIVKKAKKKGTDSKAYQKLEKLKAKYPQYKEKIEEQQVEIQEAAEDIGGLDVDSMLAGMEEEMESEMSDSDFVDGVDSEEEEETVEESPQLANYEVNTPGATTGTEPQQKSNSTSIIILLLIVGVFIFIYKQQND